MKHLSLSLIIALFPLLVSAQTVTNKQYELITKRTADWCPKCGEYGWTLFKNLETKLKNENALVWAVHYSGNLKNETTTAIDEIFGGFGQPIFYLNDADLFVDKDNIKDIEDLVVQSIKGNLFGDAYIGIELLTEINPDNTYNFKVAAKTFEAIQANTYNVGLYLINDSLVAFQQSVGYDALHTGVLTKSIIPEKLGKQIFVAPLTNGQEAKLEWKNINLDLKQGELPQNHRVAAILWAKESGGRTIYYNASVKNLGEAVTTATNDISLLDEIKLSLNDAQDQLYLETGDQISDIISTQLVSVNGVSINHSMDRQGSRAAFIEIKENLPPGIYYLRVQGKNGAKAYSFMAK